MATSKEKTSWVTTVAEASKKFDKVQFVAGAGMITYGVIAAASGPVGWGIATLISIPVTSWLANRAIEWDKKRHMKKQGTVYAYGAA